MIRGIRFVAPEGGETARLDRILRSRFPGIPARAVRHAIEAGQVRVNGVRARKGGEPVRGGDRIDVETLSEAGDWLPAAGGVPGAEILFDDGVVAVLDKPPGVHTEPQRPGEKGTLAGHLFREHPGVAAVAAVPGLTFVSRLDFETSGAILAGLTPKGFRSLVASREAGRIRKVYLCVVEGILSRPIVVRRRIRPEGGTKVRVAARETDPDPDRWTRVTPVRSSGGRTLVRARIVRGRRHQIRAHLATAGHPIVGDRLYGERLRETPPGGRLMLHAEEVVFPHPETGREVRVVSAAPAAFGAI